MISSCVLSPGGSVKHVRNSLQHGLLLFMSLLLVLLQLGGKNVVYKEHPEQTVSSLLLPALFQSDLFMLMIKCCHSLYWSSPTAFDLCIMSCAVNFFGTYGPIMVSVYIPVWLHRHIGCGNSTSTLIDISNVIDT